MQTVGLPYINNAKAVLVTLAINLGVVFLFNWPDGITFSGILWDSVFCAVITSIVNIWIVYPRLKKMRTMGTMPEHVPENRFIQRLPKNPILLGMLYAAVFSIVMVGINALITWFFGIQNMTFRSWLFYKLVYATILSIKIIEYCIFRYVQPDWAKAGNSVNKTGIAYTDRPVKNPLPKISVFKEMFAGVTGNIAMNIIIGSVLGGTIILSDHSVVIYPTTIEGIPITGLVFGLIVGILVTRGVLKSVNRTILENDPAIMKNAVENKWFTWMPKGEIALTCLVCFCVMLFSAVALRAIMILFDIAVMNFYQFTVFITLYATFISKPLSFLLVKRCMQSDYIKRIYEKS